MAITSHFPFQQAPGLLRGAQVNGDRGAVAAPPGVRPPLKDDTSFSSAVD